MFGNQHNLDHNISLGYIYERMHDIQKDAQTRRLLKQAQVLVEVAKKPAEKVVKDILYFPRLVLSTLQNSR